VTYQTKRRLRSSGCSETQLTLAGPQRATSLNLYVLEGSVHKAGHRVRITAQLVDALSGAHLWADRFDASLEDIFKLQDKGGGERRICR
jgi:TolB-like protein